MKSSFLIAVLGTAFWWGGGIAACTHAQPKQNPSSSELTSPIHTQNIQRIYEEALTSSVCYQNLEYLCLQIGHRLSGSPQAEKAVNYTQELMQKMKLDSVFLQEVYVPHWKRGKKAIFKTNKGESFPILALGNSVGGKVNAPIIEFTSMEQLEKASPEEVKGKIVFMNHAFDQKFLDTFEGYGNGASYRVRSASKASKLGAVGVVVRSVGTDEVCAHTGVLVYAPDFPSIPAAALKGKDADRLSKLLAQSPTTNVTFEMDCQMLPDALSYNVIGEIKGSEKPDEIILVSGHLDSWDVGHGAHDDGTGCMQAIEVLRIFQQLGIKPKRTIRAVMYMNEENGLRGGRKYAEKAQNSTQKHIAALESDRGGFSPRGFEIGAKDTTQIHSIIQQIKPYLEKYDLHKFFEGEGGADIYPLLEQGTLLFGLVPDSQRYFDLHHTEADTFDKVNRRELQLGAAAMAALVYLLSEEGIKE